jgi:actin
MIFDTFNVPNFYIANQAVMGLYSTGRTTGIVLNSGSGATFSVPVYEGYSLPHTIMKMDLAGDVLSQNLSEMLKDLQISLMKYQH